MRVGVREMGAVPDDVHVVRGVVVLVPVLRRRQVTLLNDSLLAGEEAAITVEACLEPCLLHDLLRLP
jgi:hypothetical protein